MSSTRRTSKTGTLRQERFASSSSLPKGLLGNLVAKRCLALAGAEEKSLIHFLHELSLRDGYALHRTCNLFPRWPWVSEAAKADERAFERVARELTEFFPERIAPKHRERFRRVLPRYLVSLCLDPGIELRNAGVPNFDRLADALFEYKQRMEAAPVGRLASTIATRTIFELLDYALSERGIVLATGTYRIGKSYSSQAWAQMHLGQARYVQLSSAADHTAFYRDIARSLGVACSTQMKAAHIRNRIEEVLRAQHLLLILDECDYLMPQAINLKAYPERVNWLMTSVVNNGVSVALIGSQNFVRMLEHVEKRCPIWGSEQFHGRIKLRQQLPESLEPDDLQAIAATLLPDSEEAALLALVAHALRSHGYVAALESGAARARFFARQANVVPDYYHVMRVMQEAGTLKSEELPHPAGGSRSSRESLAVPARRLAASAATPVFSSNGTHG